MTDQSPPERDDHGGNDNAGDVTSAAVSGGATTAGSYSYTYTVGTADKPLIQIAASSAAGTTTSYSYNTLNELTAASTGTASSSYSYSYDADGNLLTENLGGTTHTHTYNSADELCWAYVGTSSNACGSAPSGATTYTYDGAGNQATSSAGESNTYNGTGNQTVSMTSPAGGSSLAMTYTGLGNQQRTTAGSTNFTYGLLGLASSYNSATGTQTNYTWDPSGRLNSATSGGNRYYYLYDGTGSVIGLIDSSGNQDASYRYDSYGTTTLASGANAASNPFRYEGGYTDSTGYIKFGARYYNPTLGSWTQLDPSGQNTGYEYAGSNPLNVVDVNGEDDASLGLHGAMCAIAIYASACNYVNPQGVDLPSDYGPGVSAVLETAEQEVITGLEDLEKTAQDFCEETGEC